VALPLIQNFSIPAGNSVEIDFELPSPDDEILSGFNVVWKAYEQEHGVVTIPLVTVITKSLEGGGITLGTAPISFTISIAGADTVNLLDNYYHEAAIVDPSGGVITSAQGVMTITQAEIT
jgi:hypothetical protein